MPSFIDIQGQFFGRLKVIERCVESSKRVRWICQCSCGEKVAVDGSKLRNGHTQSCGCLQKERASSANKIHGHSSYPNKGRSTKEYNTWSLMRKRCESEKCAEYHLYGGRGIYVCERWMNFENFLSDMGQAPSAKHSIDRIDFDGPYSPDNCRWADAKTQNRNRRITVFLTCNGVTKSVGEWSDVTGLDYKLIHARIKRGLDPVDVLKPVQQKR